MYWVPMSERSNEYEVSIDELPDLVSDLELNIDYGNHIAEPVPVIDIPFDLRPEELEFFSDGDIEFIDKLVLDLLVLDIKDTVDYGHIFRLGEFPSSYQRCVKKGAGNLRNNRIENLPA